MKKFALAAFLLASSVSAQATGLSVIGSNAITFSGYDGQPVDYTGARSTGFTGAIHALFAGNLEAVYLGEESGNLNRFRFEVSNRLDESDVIGQSIFTVVDAGLIDFRFRDITDGEVFINGSTSNFAIMDGMLPNTVVTDYGPFDYIIGFNDNRKVKNDGTPGDRDYDDFVVGLRFMPVSEVPVPAALPLMATALGLFGLSRRRQSKS